MDTSIATAATDILRTLPAEDPSRHVILQRLTELCAGGEAAAALRSAAARARDAARGRTGGSDAQLLADVLSAASAMWDGGAAQSGSAARRLPATSVDVQRLTSLASGDTEETGARELLSRAAALPGLAAIVRSWIGELREIAVARPSTGACTVATALRLWMWTASHAQHGPDPREPVADELAEAFCWLAAARCQIMAVVHDTAADTAIAARAFLSDLCHVQAARSAGAAATICAELVFGYRRHPAWDAEGCAACYKADDLDLMEAVIPGIAASIPANVDVIEADGSHASKAGPCARFDGLETFTRLRTRLDACLTGARLTKDRAAEALPRVLATIVAIR